MKEGAPLFAHLSVPVQYVGTFPCTRQASAEGAFLGPRSKEKEVPPISRTP